MTAAAVPLRSVAADPASLREERLWLISTTAIGGALRLLAALAATPTPGDDIGRLMVAGRWALHPYWYGLSGIWSPLHTYLLGALIHFTGHPLMWARIVGWCSTTIALPLFYLCVRDLYGSVRRAGLAALLLSLYYVHIWIAGTAYTEGPYLAFLLASLWGVIRVARPGARHAGRDALLAGLGMTVAILLRHEAKVVWLVTVPWLLLRVDRGVLLRFALPSGIAFAWQLLEPSIRGASFMADVELVTRWKLAEVTMHGSKLEGLRRWIVMPSGSPSVVVLALGLFGLWSLRKELRRDLFALLFLAQAGLFFTLSLYPGWQPYLRYMLLYFLCLLPHAAWTLQRIAVRRTWLVAALIALALLNQGVAWSRGRNLGRPLGWLPLFRPAAEQARLDDWVAHHLATRRAFVVSGYPQAWDVLISLVRADRCDLLPRYKELTYDELAELDRGRPLDLGGYEVLLLDPASPRYAATLRAAPHPIVFELRAPRLEVARLQPPGP